jgi:hypothetical protein
MDATDDTDGKAPTVRRASIQGQSNPAVSSVVSVVRRRPPWPRVAPAASATLGNLALSLTLHHHRYAIALFVCAYSFCKVHSTMGCTPAVAVKLAGETWTIEKLIDEAAK